MNDLQLLLAVSPGGTDAITGVMAKAPPGESPPANAASFLQILLQSLPGGRGECPRADLLTVLPAVEVCDEQTTETEEPLAPGDGTSPAEPSAISLPAMELAALAVAFPAAIPSDLQLATPTDAPGVDAATVTPSAPRTVRGEISAALTEAEIPRTPMPVLTTATEPPDEVDAQPVKMNAEIPAPETREGSAKGEKPVLLETAMQAATAKMAAKGAENVPPEPTTAPEPLRQDQYEAELDLKAGGATPKETRQPEAIKPHSISVEAAPPEDLPEVPPPVVSRDVYRPQVKATQNRIVVPEMAHDSAQARVMSAGGDRVAMKGPEEPSERPPLRVSGGRLAEGAPEKDLRAAPTGKTAERVVLVDLPVMPDVPENAVPAAERSSRGEKVAPPQGAEGAPEPPAAQPTHTGAASISREASEPIAGRQSPGGVQVHAVKESGSNVVNDGHGVSGKMHVRLTDELSRSMLDQVVKHVALQVRGGMSEMRIRLDPPSLGEMQVTVRVDEGRVQAQIDVSQPAVRVALETSVPQLRQTLADHGIEVHRIDVCASGSSMSRESSEGHGHRPRKRDGGRPQGTMDGVEQYRGARMMGYNTIEMVM